MTDFAVDFAELRAPGLSAARRAAEIAAAGGHGLLLTGPPGIGATMLARRIPGLLPPMTADEQADVTWIYIATGLARAPIADRPLRAPHHSVSAAAMADARHVGEIALAHGGVLYLDDICEFSAAAIRAVRSAVEKRSVRVRGHRYPVELLLVGWSLPCPCGWRGSPVRVCGCSPDLVRRYRERHADAIQAMFDLYVTIAPIGLDDLKISTPAEDTATIRARVVAARKRRAERALDPPAADDRMARVARTICDLDGRPDVDAVTLAEATVLTHPGPRG